MMAASIDSRRTVLISATRIMHRNASAICIRNGTRDGLHELGSPERLGEKLEVSVSLDIGKLVLREAGDDDQGSSGMISHQLLGQDAASGVLSQHQVDDEKVEVELGPMIHQLDRSRKGHHGMAELRQESAQLPAIESLVVHEQDSHDAIGSSLVSTGSQMLASVPPPLRSSKVIVPRWLAITPWTTLNPMPVPPLSRRVE